MALKVKRDIKPVVDLDGALVRFFGPLGLPYETLSKQAGPELRQFPLAGCLKICQIKRCIRGFNTRCTN